MSHMRKAPKSSDDVNEKISAFLFELANYEKNVSRNTHKYSAYRKAASAIAAHDKPIGSGEQAMTIKGVGKKIGAKIDEFLATGKLQKLEKIRADDTSSAINLLTRVAGVGPVKARELVEKGVTSIEELRKREDLLSKAQNIGLKHFEDFEKRVPREEIQRCQERIERVLRKGDKEYEAVICGSYRRGRADSGDVDVLVTHGQHASGEVGKEEGARRLRQIVDWLTEDGLITDVISLGGSKFSGVCRDSVDSPSRRLDVRILPKDQFACGLLYFTGSDQFNKEMRAFALEKGFTLNEYSLRPVDAAGQPGEPLPVLAEEDVFDYIGYKYRPPQERDV